MIQNFLTDQQDEKIIQKIYPRLIDMLSAGEEIIYIAVQKKPIVNLLADSVAITNKRIIFFTPENFGLSMKTVDLVWKDIVAIQFKEEILGAVFWVKTRDGSEISVDYLSKIQARRLCQHGLEQRDMEREFQKQAELERKNKMTENTTAHLPINPEIIAKPAPVIQSNEFTPAPPMQNTPFVQTEPIPVTYPAAQIPAIPVVDPISQPDELTLKLKKLKSLYDQGLISVNDYEFKKKELLSDL